MKINLWYSKGMHQWRWTLCEEFKNGVTKMEQHSGTQRELRDAMNDVANTVEYMLDERQISKKSYCASTGTGGTSVTWHRTGAW